MIMLSGFSLRVNQDAQYCHGTIMLIAVMILIHGTSCSLDRSINAIDGYSGRSSLNLSNCSTYADSGEVIRQKMALYFLVMAPYPDCSPFNPSWEGGPAVVPAAIVAKDLINQRDDILRDYRLEFVVRDSGCNMSSKAVNSLVEEVLHSNNNIVGIVGPGCSEATFATATLVTDDHISLIQLAPSATSPDLTNTTLYPNTFRPIVSALGFVDTYIQFIKMKGYQHVGALYEAGRPFQVTVYTHFRERISKQGIKLTAFGLFGDHFPLDEFLLKVRVIFVFTSSGFARQLLCSAYQERMFHPDYQFIFSNRKPRNFLSNVSLLNGMKCERLHMKKIVTGMIFNDFRLQRQDGDENETHPGISFNEFDRRYTKVRECHLKMLKLGNAFDTEHYSGYFDATWALALSLNNSLPRLQKEKGLSLSNYTYQMPNVTRIIKEELLKLSFEGMRGRIEFSSESNDCVNSTIIDVYQVLNTSAADDSLCVQVVGEYNSSLQDNPLKFSRNDVLLPQSNFDLTYVMPGYSIGVSVAIIAVLLFFVLLTCHIAYVVWRQYRTIKASSPRLAHLIFIGCYLAIFGTIVYTNTYVFIRISEETTTTVFTAHCFVLHWAISLTSPFVIGTLCVKTWRVYCIFYKYNSWLADHLDDKLLIIVLLLFLALTVVLNILWNATSPWHFDVIQDPDLQAVALCRTKDQLAWVIVVTLPQGILTMFVVYLAIATRGVRKEEFKETKSINSFLFCLLLLQGACLPLSFILGQGANIHYGRIVFSYVSFCLQLLGWPVLCTVFLISPPLLPLIKDKVHMYYRRITPPTPV